MCEVQDMTVPESWASKNTSQAHRLLRPPHHHRPGQNGASHFSPWRGQRRVPSPRTEALATLAQRRPSGAQRLQPPAVWLWAGPQADCLISVPLDWWSLRWGARRAGTGGRVIRRTEWEHLALLTVFPSAKAPRGAPPGRGKSSSPRNQNPSL